MKAVYALALATLGWGAAHAVVLPPPPTPGSAMVKIQGGLSKPESDRALRAHHHKFHHGKDYTRDDTIFGEPSSAPANADPGVSPIVLAPARPTGAVQAAPCVPVAAAPASITGPRAGDIAAATARSGDRAAGKTAAPAQQQPTAVNCDIGKPLASPARPAPAPVNKASTQKPATTVAPGKNS